MSEPKWKRELIHGYQTFRNGLYKTQKKIYSELGSKGQQPNVMIIACSDSRADPSDIFDTYPGEIFVLRNVANIVPPYEADDSYHGSSAAIEFAVNHLKVKAIVVMGHADCGGIKAHLGGYAQQEPSSFIGKWVDILATANTDKCHGGTAQFDMELNGVLNSIENLKTFPFIKTALDAGDLDLMGAYFSIEHGKLLFADEDGEFAEVGV
ncbi:MAG: carbonic anhydrase [Hyphomonadaceae bacterium]|nr:carbonic anhydrase [Hyphomonadaceae bacterium]